MNDCAILFKLVTIPKISSYKFCASDTTEKHGYNDAHVAGPVGVYTNNACDTCVVIINDIRICPLKQHCDYSISLPFACDDGGG